MKKILLCLSVCVVLPFMAGAYTVNVNEAMEKASSFFLSKQNPAATKASDASALVPISLIWPASIQSTASTSEQSDKGEPAFYIFNRNDEKGFVIVSAESSTIEILAYSLDDAFDIESMSHGPNVFLDAYSEQIAAIRSGKATPLKAGGNNYTKHELETAHWNQDGLCFNSKYAPVSGQDTCYSGCAATAMAIMMKYHKWPLKGEGSNSYVSKKLEIPLSMDFSTITFDWENMPSEINSISSEYQSDQISQLMKACGVAVNMDYGGKRQNGSSSHTAYVCGALRKYFHYDYCQFIQRDSTDSSWASRIMHEIDNQRPVIVGGTSTTVSNAGHEFIIDGYDEQGMFRYNLGWGGKSAYYADGKISTDYNFLIKEAIIGIQPRDGKADDPYSPLSFSYMVFSPKGNINGCNLFNIRVINLSNTSTEGFRGYLAIVLSDKDKKVKATASLSNYFDTIPVSMNYLCKDGGSYDYFTFNLCQIPQDVTIEQTDRLWLASSTDKGATWKLIYMVSDSISSYAVAGHENDMTPYSPIMFSNGSESISIAGNWLPFAAGKRFDAKLTNFYNYGSNKYNGELFMAVCDSATMKVKAVVSNALALADLNPRYGYKSATISCTLPNDVPLRASDLLTVVTKAKGESSYAYVTTIRFQMITIPLRAGQYTSIESVTTDSENLSGRIRIFALDGRLVRTCTSEELEETLSVMPQNIYILKSDNNLTRKILVK